MKAAVIATVTYTCELTDGDEQKVRAYAKEHGVSFDTAIKELWESDEIDVYAGSVTESDSFTEEIGYSEFNKEEDEKPYI